MPLRYRTQIHTLRHHWQGGRRESEKKDHEETRTVPASKLQQIKKCQGMVFILCLCLDIKMMVSEGSEGMDAHLINNFMLTDM